MVDVGFLEAGGLLLLGHSIVAATAIWYHKRSMKPDLDDLHIQAHAAVDELAMLPRLDVIVEQVQRVIPPAPIIPPFPEMPKVPTIEEISESIPTIDEITEAVKAALPETPSIPTAEQIASMIAIPSAAEIASAMESKMTGHAGAARKMEITKGVEILNSIDFGNPIVNGAWAAGVTPQQKRAIAKKITELWNQAAAQELRGEGGIERSNSEGSVDDVNAWLASQGGR